MKNTINVLCLMYDKYHKSKVLPRDIFNDEE